MVGGGGPGQGWPRPTGGRPDGGFDGRGRFGNGCDMDETTFAVPAEKCGLVIGKGGQHMNLTLVLLFAVNFAMRFISELASLVK